MTTLAIFGDSFAHDTSPQWEVEWADIGPSWIDHIQNTTNYQITNFASSGTSTYWSKNYLINIIKILIR